VIKLDIINEVVNRTGITKTKAELAVETVFQSMKKALTVGDRIELRGFGVFNVRPRKTGIGRNPRTGAEVSFPWGQNRSHHGGHGDTERAKINSARPRSRRKCVRGRSS
jgi:DNA-binding protein HU-beta